jgi:filamentous hemagglutinin family protein
MRNAFAPAPLLTRRKLYVAMVTASQLMLAGQSYASPEGGQVVGGAGKIDQSGRETVIRQQTDRMAIDWQSFDVKADERVQFIQPGASSVALNRVISNKGSEILGRIDANGQVFLVNPNGVVFGKDSQINVGGILASGLSINPTDFMNGNFTLSEVEGAAGKVVNSGIINASTGGSVTLIGKEVTNNGLIIANLGAVNLAVGKEAVVTFESNGLVGVKVTKEVLQSELGVDPALVNNGEINAEGGRILLTASTSQDIFSQAVNHEGMNASTSVVVNEDGSFTLGGGADVVNTGKISASAAYRNAGQIVFVGDKVTNSGSISADSQTGNGGHVEINSRDTTILNQTATVSAQSVVSGKGGDVKILGDKVGLMDTASVNASGANGGGQVLIGGDETGKNKLINNANFIYLGENTNVKTDAFLSGNGGKLITFAQDTARIYGNLYSRGGSESGNGGFIETSGLRGFEILNTPDITAQNGIGGIWLIDPYNLLITGQGGGSDGSGTQNDPFKPNRAIDAKLNVSTLTNALVNGATVYVSTGSAGSSDGNITLGANLDYNKFGTATLQFDAASNIDIEANITQSGLGKLNLILNANGAGHINDASGADKGNIVFDPDARIETEGGNFTATGKNFTIKARQNNEDFISTNGGNVSLTMTGEVVLYDAVNVSNPRENIITTNGGNFTVIDSKGFDSSGATIDTSSADHTGGGDIKITSTGSINDVKLGVLKFGYTQNSANETIPVNRIGTVDVNSEGKVSLASDIEFNNTGARNSVTGLRFSGTNATDNPELKITAVGNITIDGSIFDIYGDARDALDIVLKSTGQDGVITINKAIYTSGGNFTAESSSFNSTVLINTDHANDGNQLGSSDATWSNGGNITISASSSITLSDLITDASATASQNGNARTGNLIIQGINKVSGISADDVSVSQEASKVISVAGTTTFNVGGGDIILGSGTNPFTLNTNNFKGAISFLSANDVKIKNDLATLLGESDIKGTFDLSSGGNITQVSDKGISVAEATTFTLTGTNKDVTLENKDNGVNYFNSVAFGGAVGSVRLRDQETLTIVGGINSTGNVTLATVGVLDVNAISTTASIDLTGTGGINLKGNLTASGGSNILIRNNANIVSPVEIKSTGQTPGVITFSGTVNSTSNSNLTVSGGTVSFNNNVGVTNRIGALKVDATGDFNGAGHTFGAASFDLKANNIFADTLSSLVGGVTLEANKIDITKIDTRKVNGAGGNVNVNVNSTAVATVEIDSIDTSGGLATDVGLSGGNIVLKGGDITVGAINVSGSNAVDGSGGNAGTITITATDTSQNGTPTITLNADITAAGGLKAGVDPAFINGAQSVVNLAIGSDADSAGAVFLNFTNPVDMTITGGSGTDTLNGFAAPATWAIDGTNTLALTTNPDPNAPLKIINFSSFENLVGGSAVDIFDVLADFAGNISGGSGNDIFNVGIGALGANKTLIATLQGGNDTDILNGPNLPSTWTLGIATETLSATETPDNKIHFSGIENILAGNLADTFDVTGSIGQSRSIDAGDSESDAINVENDLEISLVNGFSFNSVKNAEVVRSKNKGKLTVSSSSGMLVNWVFDAENSVSTKITTNNVETEKKIKFNNFDSFLGGDGNDVFALSSSTTIAGLINGGEGTNTLNFSGNRSVEIRAEDASSNLTVDNFSHINATSGSSTLIMSDTIGRTWTISGANSGSINNVNTGVIKSTNFTGFNNLTGGGGSDIFRFSTNSASITGSINGGMGLGQNEIVARSGTGVINTWKMSGNNSGSLEQNSDAPSTYADFLNIQKFIGAGTDTMDYSELVGVDAKVQVGDSTSGASGMTKFIGNGTANSEITGLNTPSIWQLTGVKKGTVAPVNDQSPIVSFENFSIAIGGSSNDTFNIVSDFAGTIRGGNGDDTFKFTSSSTSEVYGGIGNDIFDIDAAVGKLFGNEDNDTFNVLKADISGSVYGGVAGETNELKGVGGIENTWILTSANGGTLNKTSSSGISFESIQSLVGAEADSLTGINQSNRWTILGKNAGELEKFDNPNDTINFSGMGKLVGGSAQDYFDFSQRNDSAITKIVDGGGNANQNTIRGRSGAGANSWLIYAGDTSGQIQTSSGVVYVEKFQNIKNRTLNENDSLLVDSWDLSIDVPNGVSIRGSNSDSSTLTGSDNENFWTINNKNSGIVTYSNKSVSFFDFANLVGGSGKDTFIFFPNGNVSGNLNGGAGDTSGVNTIIGRNDTANAWQMTGTNSGEVKAAGATDAYVKFQNIQKITGGSLIDTLYGIVNGTNITEQNWRLNGTNNENTFYLANPLENIKFIGIENIEGGSGVNTVINNAGAQTWEITGANHGKIDIFNFSKINALKGNGSDTLKGRDQDNNWKITGAKSGSVSENIATPIDTLQFSGINNLVGGSGFDVFNLGAEGDIGNIDGGGIEANTLVSTARANTWRIESETKTLTAFGTTTSTVAFRDISDLTGGSGFRDTFNIINASGVTGVLDGGAGENNIVDLTGYGGNVSVGVGRTADAAIKIANITELKANISNRNTLIADDIAGNIFTITGEDSGMLGTMTFDGFRNLTGRQYADTFVFAGKNAKLSGVVDGGTYAGVDGAIYTDILDLSTSGSDRSVAMSNGGSTKGGAINIVNIESAEGSASFNNAFFANDNKNTWSIDGTNSGSISNEGIATPIEFSNFDILVGGAKDDSFAFLSTGKLSGYIDGGAHETADVVDLSKLSGIVEISLDNLNGYRSIERFIGNNSDSTLYGNNNNNIWNLTGVSEGNINNATFFTGFTSLVGGTGEDRFELTQGQLSGSVYGGEGKDIFNISNSVIDGSIEGGIGDDTLNATISTSSAETIRFIGGDGANILNVLSKSGDTNTYFATHGSAVSGGGVLRYDVNNSSHSIRYSNTKEVNDLLIADTLTIDGTDKADTFSLFNNSYLLNGFTTIKYENKNNLVVAGAVDDKISIATPINIANLFTIKRASVETTGTGVIRANGLALDGSVAAGKVDNRLQTNVANLLINTSAGDIYIQEQNGLNISGFNSNNKFDLLLDGSLTSDVELASIAEFNVEVTTGNIILDKNNALTGELNLKAPGNITLNNSTGTTFGNISADTLNVNSLGAIQGNGVTKVGGLTTLGSGLDITFENVLNDFTSVSITNAQNVSLFDSGLLTLSTVGAIGNIKTQSQGIIVNGAVNSGSLVIDAGGGRANLANTINAQTNVDITAQNIVVSGNIDAKGNIKASTAGEFSQSANMSGGSIELNVGRYIANSGTTTATNGAVSINSISDISTKNITATNDIILKTANDLTIGGVINASAGKVDLLAGRNIILNNDVNGQGGANVEATNGSVQLQALLASGNGDVDVTTSGDVVMGANASTTATAGNITYAGKNLTVTALSASAGEVIFKADGSVVDGNAAANNITATRFVVDSMSGIGALDDIETSVAGLSLSNQLGDIRVANTGAVTIDRLRTNGNIVFSNTTGNVILDNRKNALFSSTETDALLAGGTVNSNYNVGNLSINIRSGNLIAEPSTKLDVNNPDLTALNATVIIDGGEFGSITRPLSVYVKDTFFLNATRSWNPFWGFNIRPFRVENISTLQGSLSDLLSAGAEQLVEVEELNEVNPAIFTNVRNYVYDDIAIMLPADQRYDDDSLSSN